MHLLSFQYFVVIAEELNLTKASARLYVSQQSLSQHIAKLEKQYGVKLLERTTPLKLTYAGRIFYKTAKQMIELDRQLSKKMRDIHDGATDMMHIGMTYNRSRFLLPQILISYKKLFPGIEIVCHGDNPNANVLERKLLNKQYDFIFYAASLKENKELTFIDIKIDPVVMVVQDAVLKTYCADSYEHIIRHAEEGVDISEVRNCPLLMYPLESHTRQALEKLFEEKGILPNIAMQSESVETLYSLAIMGMGISFCPEMYLPLLSQNNPTQAKVHFIPLKAHSTASRMGLAYRKDRQLSDADKKFIVLIQEMFQGTGKEAVKAE